MTLNAALAQQDYDHRIEHFSLRVWARSRLYRFGELSLHEAVDELQHAAEAQGIVLEIGQDAVQAIIAREFEAVR